MKICLLFLPFLLSTLTPLAAEELLKTTGFSDGKGAWHGPGTVIYLSADGKEQLLPSMETTAVLRVTLSKNRWSVLEHRVRLGRKQSKTTLAIELQTSQNFAPQIESKEYAKEVFSEGGWYVWSARIFPKAGLLIQLSENGGWQYLPKALLAASAWETISVNFTSQSKSTETLALCLPPGAGFVDFKSVSLNAE